MTKGTTTMTTDLTTEYSLTALTQILSALDGQKRNPCTKKAAIKAIHKKAEALGLAPDDVFDAAAALLGGQDAVEWLAEILDARDERAQEAETIEALQAEEEARAKQAEPEAEAPAEPAQEDEPEEFVDPEFAALKKTRKSRKNSKQARMIEMLKRPEGATVEQIGEEFGWQKHTVRGAISGALRKKLGLNITSGKIDGQLTYRIDD